MKLFPPQEDALRAGLLDSPRHFLLNMATGSGKTYLAELAIEKTLTSGYKAVYVTPLRALAEQQKRHFQNKYPNHRIGIFTGETIYQASTRASYGSSQILIMTPERLDSCLRHWRSHWNWIPDVSLVVLDEFHLLGLELRGARLEGTITRLIRLNPFVRFIGLSATMPNAKELAAWLHGCSYSSPWRQIPLEMKFVRFSKASDKPSLLQGEVQRCLQEGGQSLIFCNSRARTEELSALLQTKGICAACHHAGLVRDHRIAVETRFLNREIHALVTTSTLEMGLNLPARQVVIYDSSIFTETGFEDLPVWSFIQRAGRAGRPGLDKKGEVVLILPKWVSKNKYLYEMCEPITSQLTSTKAMAEQLLIDVFAGYSKTRDALSNGFLPLTLYKAQHEGATLNRIINELILADLLIEKEKDGVNQLKVSLLGRLSVKLMISPSTVRLIQCAYKQFSRLYIFDLLLLATLSEDCSPILRTNYEEIDILHGTVSSAPSCLMDLSVIQLQKELDGCGDARRILSAVKMATLCYGLTTGKSIRELANLHHAYPADISILQESVVRLLRSFSVIFTAFDKLSSQDQETSSNSKAPYPAAKLGTLLADMVEYEISSDLVGLTRIPGVGGKTAKTLANHGYSSIQKISSTSLEDLSTIKGIGEKRALTMIKQAKEILQSDRSTSTYREDHIPLASLPSPIKMSIDPYRLRRATDLRLQGSDGDRHLITGGREDHIVRFTGESYSCDCLDFVQSGNHCKHILCLRLALGDPEIQTAVNHLKRNKHDVIRESLHSLWYSS